MELPHPPAPSPCGEKGSKAAALVLGRLVDGVGSGLSFDKLRTNDGTVRVLAGRVVRGATSLQAL